MLAKGGERVVVFGSYVVMQDIVRRLGLNIEVRRINAADAAQFQPQGIEVIDTTRITEPLPIGRISAISGPAAFDAIVAAIAAAKSGEVSGIVTAPINKEAMASAEIRYPGHTGILADYAVARAWR